MIVEPGFWHHWKTKLLISTLGDEKAPMAVLKLWSHCQERKTHKLKLTVEALAVICEWRSTDANKLMEALIACKFLDKASNGLIVHDWDKQNWYLVNAWKNGRKHRTHGIPIGNPRVTHPSNLIISNNKSTSTKSTSVSTVPEEDWLETLKASPAYQGIDVERVYNKMVEWCKLMKRSPTKRRLLNWLNRQDAPLFQPIKQERKEPIW